VSSKTFLLNKAKGIAFDEGSHSYYNRGGEFTSVSKVISWYVKPFNSKAISLAIAKRDNVSQKSVLKLWEDKKDVALERGNRIHNALEKYFNQDPATDFEGLESIYCQIDEMVSATGFYEFLTEQIIFNTKNLLSGTIDLMRFNPDGTVSLFDYKTNKEITKSSKYKNKLLNGLEHLEDCHLTKYSLQLGLYKWMLEQDGFVVKDLHLIHINHDGVVELIKCLDLSKEIEEVIMREEQTSSSVKGE